MQDIRRFAAKRLVLFDLDGVLVDTSANMQAAWSTVCRELALDIPFDCYLAEIGRPFPAIMRRLGLEALTERAEAIYRARSSLDLASALVYAGVASMLRELHAARVTLGIVTSKDRARTDLVLNRLPPVFSVVRCPDDSCRGKPAPDHLLIATALARCDPCEALFVGDMDSDAEAARRAGIDFVHAGWGYGQRPATALAQANCPAEIARIVLGTKLAGLAWSHRGAAR